jgi:hypothetical protein
VVLFLDGQSACYKDLAKKIEWHTCGWKNYSDPVGETLPFECINLEKNGSQDLFTALSIEAKSDALSAVAHPVNNLTRTTNVLICINKTNRH